MARVTRRRVRLQGDAREHRRGGEAAAAHRETRKTVAGGVAVFFVRRPTERVIGRFLQAGSAAWRHFVLDLERAWLRRRLSGAHGD